MLARLALKNLVGGLGRGVFTIVAITAALLINGFYASYAERSQLQSGFLPGQARTVMISPRAYPPVGESDIRGLPGVVATLAVKSVDGTLEGDAVKVWLYTGGSGLLPDPADGALPKTGECLIPSGLARSIGADVGDSVFFRPASAGEQGTFGGPRSLVVAGIADDPVWSAVLVPVDDLRLEGGSIGIVAGLEPGLRLTRWLRDFRALDLGRAVALGEAAEPESGGDLSDRLLARLANLILIVGALVGANSVALALVERGTEVALLRAIGVGSGETMLMYLGEATLLSAVGVAFAYGFSLAATAFLPALAGDELPATILKGGAVALAVTAVGCLVILGTWHAGSPMDLLRKRGA